MRAHNYEDKISTSHPVGVPTTRLHLQKMSRTVKSGYKRRIVVNAPPVDNEYPTVSLKQFKDFFCVKAFDIISENRYRKFIVKAKVVDLKNVSCFEKCQQIMQVSDVCRLVMLDA